jgi:hypothetical protein
MSKLFLSRWFCAVLLLMATYALVPTPTAASHVWGPYHWARTSSAIKNVPVRRLHSAAWITRYNLAVNDWKKTSLTKIRAAFGATGAASKTCAMVTGQITSCDASYGNTGWLGLATINISGSHIVRGNSKVNNTYFNMSAYNTVAWRQAVICQEIGHNFGLGHVNEVFTNANTGSCMDYTNDPDGGPGGGSNSDPDNMNPNAHDYALINSRHNHVGSRLRGFDADHVEFRPEKLEMPSAVAAFNPTRLSDLGTLVAIGDGGRTAQYQKDFGNGFRAASFVVRAH